MERFRIRSIQSRIPLNISIALTCHILKIHSKCSHTNQNSKYFPFLQQIAQAILLVTAAAEYWSVHQQQQPPTNHKLSSVRLSPRTWLTSCVSVTAGNEICTNLVKWTFSWLSTSTIYTNSIVIH